MNVKQWKVKCLYTFPTAGFIFNLKIRDINFFTKSVSWLSYFDLYNGNFTKILYMKGFY